VKQTSASPLRRKKENTKNKKKQERCSHFVLLMYYEELFCQTGCQNGFSSIERAVRGAKAKKKWLHQ
jgi:hypothetical protein